MKNTKRLFAEWEPQEALLFALPHEGTDWAPYLDEALDSYREFIAVAAQFQRCWVLCADEAKARALLDGIPNVTLFEIPTNDTWIRDFGAIDVLYRGLIESYDFTFNAWGGKFDAALDDNASAELFRRIPGNLIKVPLVLEGGSIDCNGEGVMLTTTTCLMEEHRNPHLGQDEIDATLKELFGLRRIIWLSHGYLRGDDTDSHVDTLARFITPDTIAYTSCTDPHDEHFDELSRMRAELEQTTFKLVPLPLPKAIYYGGHRLPATYANFVFVNGALIVPTYDDPNDAHVLQTLQKELPHLKVIGVNARVFVRQHGSLHCATMNRYEGKRS
jgi:agmatine/peptidylarginine deiminase